MESTLKRIRACSSGENRWVISVVVTVAVTIKFLVKIIVGSDMKKCENMILFFFFFAVKD